MQLEEHPHKKAFESMFKAYFQQLTYYAYKYVKDLDVSKEIVHAVFIKVWENVESFDFEGKPQAYLYTAVYNRSLNYLRDHKKFVHHEDQEVLLNASSNALEQIDNLEVAELEGRIQVALHKLPQKCRVVFELSRFEEKKYAEIAQILGISVKTVEAQMSKALKILKTELKDYLHLISMVLFFIV